MRWDWTRERIVLVLQALPEIAADRLGEHKEAVLRELLALTDAEIAGLYADKVLVRDPLLDTLEGRP
jgi:hypothetical protein